MSRTDTPSGCPRAKPASQARVATRLSPGQVGQHDQPVRASGLPREQAGRGETGARGPMGLRLGNRPNSAMPGPGAPRRTTDTRPGATSSEGRHSVHHLARGVQDSRGQDLREAPCAPTQLGANQCGSKTGLFHGTVRPAGLILVVPAPATSGYRSPSANRSGNERQAIVSTPHRQEALQMARTRASAAAFSRQASSATRLVSGLVVSTISTANRRTARSGPRATPPACGTGRSPQAPFSAVEPGTVKVPQTHPRWKSSRSMAAAWRSPLRKDPAVGVEGFSCFSTRRRRPRPERTDIPPPRSRRPQTAHTRSCVLGNQPRPPQRTRSAGRNPGTRPPREPRASPWSHVAERPDRGAVVKGSRGRLDQSGNGVHGRPQSISRNQRLIQLRSQAQDQSETGRRLSRGGSAPEVSSTGRNHSGSDWQACKSQDQHQGTTRSISYPYYRPAACSEPAQTHVSKEQRDSGCVRWRQTRLATATTLLNTDVTSLRHY